MSHLYQFISYNVENFYNYSKVTYEIKKIINLTNSQIKGIFILIQEYSSKTDERFHSKFSNFIKSLNLEDQKLNIEKN